ncbi:MAG: hypothetical protein KME64_33485 [Scytonematopsis contorta HA4267-MV1]|jgi:hypothetical protein|nr:hypothetical protein [Scytonematopsis contorta HA4267-MV1]
MDISAFVDNGFSPGKEFRVKFLSSNEFTVDTLRKIISSGTSHLRKDEIATCLGNALEKGDITSEEVLLTYVKQPRKWLSIKLGKCDCTPNLNSSATLLTEFGKDGWYGPIEDPSQCKKWYIRTYKIIDRILTGSEDTNQVDKRDIRWAVIAEVGEEYTALSWDGFTYSSTTKERIDQTAQFPFWHHVPYFFDELANHCKAKWEHPNLHKLVLHDMWDKYLNKHPYKWKHLRIRAEASGLAINAHSSGVGEIDVRGLQALSHHIAKSVVNTLDLDDDVEKISNVEDAILLIMIKEWGTKSYEFSLDTEVVLSDTEAERFKKYLFKAHCYFGLKPNSKTQDSLQHLKCYSGYYGGSTSVLDFLLNEFGLRG